MSAAAVHFFLTMRDQIKMYHWQTGIFSRHKATDNIIKSLDEHIDMFVEVYMGKYGRPTLTRTTNTVVLKNMGDKTAAKFIKDCVLYLQGPLTKSLKGVDTDLANIRDEMLADLNQLLYLFTLK